MHSVVKEFPEGMVPLGKSSFNFECNEKVECFTKCCKDVDLILYPYDIIKLKNELGIHSEQFMRQYTCLTGGENPFFPTVKLKLKEHEQKACPFLNVDGCSVYHNRPTACRTYPLERAVDRSTKRGVADEFYFLKKHEYCFGHGSKKQFTVEKWIRNQHLNEFNTMNELWVELDTLFATNPWKGEGAGGEKQQIAFMVCYNIDGFRRFIIEYRLINQFRIAKDFKKRIANEDGELMKFGFEWLKLIYNGKSSLIKK